jgi:transposase
MRLYGGDDLHSTNNVLALIDEAGKTVFRRRLPNEVDRILQVLEPYRDDLEGIAVESTFNWYWFVDGLQEAGVRVHLANPAAMQQYTGLKHGDDNTDATWIAEMFRLGILPEGYIYPREERGLRDLLRKRGQLVRQRTAQLLSIESQWERYTGKHLSGSAAKSLTREEVRSQIVDADRALGLETNLAVMECLHEQLKSLEETIQKRAGQRPGAKLLRTVAGIGKILSLTILLETGEIGRFASVGKYSSYCRCVPSQRTSNGKRKGQGNRKNGNRYLAWAFVEAAHFAVRFYPPIRRFYQRKRARTNGVVATKAVAHKLARACYYVLRDEVPFELTKSFV